MPPPPSGRRRWLLVRVRKTSSSVASRRWTSVASTPGVVQGADHLHQPRVLAHRDDQPAVVHAHLARREVAERGGRGLEARGLGRADLDPLAADLRLQLRRRAVGGDAAVVQDHDVVGQAVGLLQVLGGQHERRALGHQLPQQRPQVVAALGVEAGRGLVQEQHRRLGDQARGQVQAAAHAAGERLDQVVALVGQADALEQLVGAGADLGLGQVVEAPGQLQVAAGGQQAVHRGVLPGQPDVGPHLRGLRLHVQPGHRGGARRWAARAWSGCGSRWSCRRRCGPAGRARCRAGRPGRRP